jgi:hypothetical protein
VSSVLSSELVTDVWIYKKSLNYALLILMKFLLFGLIDIFSESTSIHYGYNL